MAPSWSLFFLSRMETWDFSLQFPNSAKEIRHKSWASLTPVQPHNWNLSSSLAILTHCFFLNQNLFHEQRFSSLLFQGSSAVVPANSPVCFCPHVVWVLPSIFQPSHDRQAYVLVVLHFLGHRNKLIDKTWASQACFWPRKAVSQLPIELFSGLYEMMLNEAGRESNESPKGFVTLELAQHDSPGNIF